MLTHFFTGREKVDAEVYYNVLGVKIIPWMKEKGAGKEFVFRQDSTLARRVKLWFLVEKKDSSEINTNS